MIQNYNTALTGKHVPSPPKSSSKCKVPHHEEPKVLEMIIASKRRKRSNPFQHDTDSLAASLAEDSNHLIPYLLPLL
jgi:hypothetical protein